MDKSNLIVNYLPSGFAESDLHDMFLPFGEIVSIKVRFLCVYFPAFVGGSGQTYRCFDGIWFCEL